jgi:dTDP-glucose 4,6-dehydratase
MSTEKKEKFVVIGSNSFSGAHFVDFLMESDSEVIGMSRSPEPSAAFLPYKSRKGNFHFHQLDLNKHLPKIMEVISRFRPEYVVNFAAQSMVAQSWQHPEHWYLTNVVANVKFHDQLRKCDFLKKYVHVSTPEVYGSCKGLIDEDAALNPTTPYAVSRAACDMHLKSFLGAYQFPVVFTRAANVFGPCQQLYRIIPRTILCVLLKQKLKLEGGGRSVRSFIHVRDVAGGTLRVARSAKPGEIYHLSTDRHHSIREVVEEVCKQLNSSFEDVVEVVGDRLGKDAAYTLDSKRAKENLEWKAKIGLKEGIKQTIEWIEKNLDEIKQQPFDYVHKE